MTRATDAPLSCLLHVLPWVLVTVGALLFVIGLSWRNLTSSDTVNPFLVIGGVLCVMLAGSMSCCADRPPMQEDDYDKPAPPTQQPQQVQVQLPPLSQLEENATPEEREARIPFVSI